MKKLIVLISLLLAPVLSLAAGEVNTFALQTQAQDQYYNYSFGTVFVNTRAWADFTLTANGPDATLVRRIVIRGFAYDADSNCPEVLMPGRTCTTRVYYWPTSQGPHWGELTFVLNDSNIYIRLFGNTFQR